MISVLMSARNFCAFWSCKTCQSVLKQPERHRLIAVNDLAVARERGPQAAQAIRQQFVGFGADARGGDIPQLEQRPDHAFRDQFADFPLEPDAMPPHSFSVTVSRDGLDRAVDQAGKRLHRLSIAACAR